MKCGLLGLKLWHSYSPQIHSRLGNYSYRLFEKEPHELEDFLRNGDFIGLNVTIPYKKSVIPYLQELSPTAKRLGAVNTIVRRSDGSLIGHNTDYFGLKTMIIHSGVNLSGKKVLILGSGGASNTAAAVAIELGGQAVVISRHGENNYSNLSLHPDASVIINATPVGMFPNVDESPISLALFPQLEAVYDLIFNPAHTTLLMEAEHRGIKAVNGLLMLVAQAKESAEWFTGTSIADHCIQDIYVQMQKQMQNIVLIGMPGCGKSTIAQALSRRTGKTVIDSDSEIVYIANQSIPDIFSKVGEDGFRKLETEVLHQLGKKSGVIISTGGGCITRSENYPSLHRNGKIIWIQRELNQLPIEGRPLSQKQQLEEMYNQRRPLYEAFADYIVDNNGTIEETVNKILNKLET